MMSSTEQRWSAASPPAETNRNKGAVRDRLPGARTEMEIPENGAQAQALNRRIPTQDESGTVSITG